MSHLARSIRHCFALAAVTSTASLVAGPALGAAGELEEIIVTAQKQEQKLSETPLSVTALSAKDLNALGATQFRDFANTVPGLQFSTTGVGSTQVNLRGITSGDNVSPTVGIYVDEVPYGSSTAFAGGAQLALDVGLFDISRVEVLRGPQGTLYGASTMGGLLKYVTTVPNLHDFGGTARAGLSTTEHGGVSYDAAAAVNLPFASDKAAARVSGFYSHDGGYVDNIALNKDDVNQSDVYGGRGDVLFQPTDQLSVRLTAYSQDITRDGRSTVDYDYATAKPVNGGLDQEMVVTEPFDQSFQLMSGTVVYDFGSVALTSVSSYQSLSNDSRIDASDLYTPLFNLLLSDLLGVTFGPTAVKYGIDTDKFVQELRLAGTGPTIDWLLGGFYSTEDSTQHQLVQTWNPDGTPLVIPVPGGMATIKLPSSYDETAGFGTVTWHATSKLDIAGGLRYSHNKLTQEQIASGLLVSANPEKSSSEDVTTYLANLRYLANDNLMGYLRFATGYRPGGPNFVLNDPETGEPLAPPTFESDKLKSYEGGIKVSTADRRFSADAALYLIDWQNMQVVANINGFGVIANAGTARSTGAELTLTALPVPALTMVGAFAYIESRTHGGCSGPGRQRWRFPAQYAGLHRRGLRRLRFRRQRPREHGGAVVRYVSDRVSGWDEGSQPQYDVPSYTTVDIRGSFAFGNATARLFVRNLFDERGQLSADTLTVLPFGGPVQVSIMQPRTYGVSIDVNF